MASSGSRYGLFIPKKSTKGTLLKPSSASVFADDSDEDSGSTAPSKNVAKQSASTRVKKQTQLEIDKALQEDPSVYEYDTIYDNIQAQKVTTSVKEANKVDRKPKYIAGLLKMAEVRKREEERRVERKVQKEREEEGNQYADKEAFVTSAYKKKMQERQEQEERERREAAMEEMLDVTKQKDLSGFYRYLYRETTGKAADEPSTAQQDRPVKQEDSGSESDSSSSSDGSADREVKHRKQDVNPRTENRHRTDSDRHRQHKSESSKDISRSDKRSKRSRSPEGDRRRRSNRSPEHSSHRHRSKDRKRNRSSSKDRVRQRSRERSRDKGSKSHKGSKVRDNRPKGRSPTREKASIKVEKPSPERETEPYQSPSREKKSTIKVEMPSPEKETESEMVMLPARPPDEDLDRDDSDSERDSETGEDQSRGDTHKEAAGKKRKGETQDDKGKDEEKAGAKFARKTTADQELDARQRFLARKLAREKARLVVEPE